MTTSLWDRSRLSSLPLFQSQKTRFPSPSPEEMKRLSGLKPTWQANPAMLWPLKIFFRFWRNESDE